MTSMTVPTGGTASGASGEVSAKQVQEWLGSGRAVLIDVREPDEFQREHIKGAVLMPLSRFDAAKAAGLASAGQRVVMQCKSGKRSADACRMAGGAGYQVSMLSGGIEGWKREGLPVEVNSGAPRISVMRQVQLVIGAGVLAGSGLAWFIDPRFLVVPAFFGAGLVFAGASGTCGLATLLGMMPWNRGGGGSCSA